MKIGITQTVERMVNTEGIKDFLKKLRCVGVKDIRASFKKAFRAFAEGLKIWKSAGDKGHIVPLFCTIFMVAPLLVAVVLPVVVALWNLIPGVAISIGPWPTLLVSMSLVSLIFAGISAIGVFLAGFFHLRRKKQLSF